METMSTVSLKKYYNTKCRFKLKSGNEIYGVIWEVDTKEGTHHYFTSLYNASKIKSEQDHRLLTQIGDELDVEEIIMAEQLVS